MVSLIKNNENVLPQKTITNKTEGACGSTFSSGYMFNDYLIFMFIEKIPTPFKCIVFVIESLGSH